MERRPLGTTGLVVPRLGLGTRGLGMESGIGSRRAPPGPEAAAALVRGAAAAGVTLFETSPAYGDSESRLGRALSGVPQPVLLVTRASPGPGLPASLAASSRRLGREPDLLLLDCGPETGPREVRAALQVLADRGWRRPVGVSPAAGHDPARLQPLLEEPGVAVVAVTYHLLDRRAEEVLTAADQGGVGALILGPLARGWLTPRARDLLPTHPQEAGQVDPYLELVGHDYQALEALALAFAGRHASVAALVVGTRNLAHLEEAVSALERPVDPEWLEWALAWG
ncbi:putative Predicted oxidoreductase [Candidatus Hydrogenisulfobacillus filiaventi]|uniref:Putative Predicted oxidoreductase n=1 Tax=Candidatus Hydrogenisulfobacillus filiaventi TaxID=2707344 RepID=A0A6F8ZJZ1_9FIRM|nr:aldo/keto reductase [Bacillota bacterium]CAB1129984.1 putative Predicted oxidoreductase [Candidatus Hydrogenisulfobacillus filiaventi]